VEREERGERRKIITDNNSHNFVFKKIYIID
jgi:hypothetical protein